MKNRAVFTHMKDSTAEDFKHITRGFADYANGLSGRVFEHLKLLALDHGGFPVSRLDHSLQAAELAMRHKESDEYVVCALLHDLGDVLCPYNHPEFAATLVQPFVGEDLTWMVRHHGFFQGYHYFHHIGLDRNIKQKFKDHEFFGLTERFVEMYDAPSFDPSLKTPPVEFFKPMLENFFKEAKNSIFKDVLKKAAG